MVNPTGIIKFHLMVNLIANGISEVFVLDITDSLGEVIDGLDEQLKKRWWWKILWPILLYGPFVGVGIYLYLM
tara:strand:- start:165 stop:383 length:219 start_codon:yes stop_codon:yes gene_type:complete